MRGLFDKARVDVLLKKASENENHQAESFNEIQEKVSTGRNAFFDKVAIFDASAIALSISFVGSMIQRGGTLHFRPVLYASWIALLLGVATAQFRNWKYHRYIYFNFLAPYEKAQSESAIAAKEMFHTNTDILSMQTGTVMDRNDSVAKLMEKATLLEEHSTAHQRMARSAMKTYMVSEKISLIISLVGISGLVLFAILSFGW